MNSGYNGTGNDLDHIRRSQGIDACRNTFGRVGKERRQNAVRLVNDSRLFFASLFILQAEIEVVSIEVCNFTPKKTNYAAMEKAF